MMRLPLVLFVALLILCPVIGHAQTSTTQPVITPENMDQVRLLEVRHGGTGFVGDSLIIYDELTATLRVENPNTEPYEIEGIRIYGYSDNGFMLALRNAEELVVWDLATGVQQSTIAADLEGVEHLTLSRDGAIVTATMRGSEIDLYVWDALTGTLLFTVERSLFDTGTHHAIADAQRVIIYGSGISIYDSQTGDRLHYLDSDELSLGMVGFSATISPDRRTLAAYAGGSVWLVDIETGEQTAYFYVTDSNLSTIFSSDNSRLLIIGESTVQLWDVMDEPFLIAIAHLALDRRGRTYALSPDGTRLAVVSGIGIDYMVHVWDSGIPELQPRFSISIPSDNLVPWFSFNHAGDILVMNGVMQLLDMEHGRSVPLINYSLYSAAQIYFNNSDTLITMTNGGTGLIFGIPTESLPEWSVTAQVVSSGINLRAAPDRSAESIGFASGEVRVGGRNGEFVYLPELDGWVLGTPDYLDMGEYTLDDLPVIAP